MPHVAAFGLGWKYSSCVVLARSSNEMAVESISNSFAAHSYTKYGSSSRFESRIIRLRPAGCAAHDRALDQFQAACAAVGIVNGFTTWDGNKRAPGFHDLFSLHR